MNKSKKQKIKEEQANMQSDLQDWTIDNSLTMMNDVDISYGQLDFGFDEEDLRKKYPALKDAHDHYQNVLDMCKTREKEINED
tara:strand:- start:397 stop:645 length:249 start_codon:yes stop_codon:yes gene_type:complete